MLYENGAEPKNVLFNGVDLNKVYYNGVLVFDKSQTQTDLYGKFEWSSEGVEALVNASTNLKIGFGCERHPTDKNALRFYIRYIVTPANTDKRIYSDYMHFTYNPNDPTGIFTTAKLSYYSATAYPFTLKAGDRAIVSFTGIVDNIGLYAEKSDWSAHHYGMISFVPLTRSFLGENTYCNIIIDNKKGSRIRYSLGIKRSGNGIKLYVNTSSGEDADNIWTSSAESETLYLGRNNDGSLITYGSILLIADTRPIVRDSEIYLALDKTIVTNNTDGKIIFNGSVFSGKVSGWFYYDGVTHDLSIEATNKNGITTFKAEALGREGTYAQGLITYNNNIGFSGQITMHYEYLNGEYEDWKMESVSASEGFTRAGLRCGHSMNGDAFIYSEILQVKE
jgi:hypothetical protein